MCEAIFTSRLGLKTHIAAIDERKKPYKCNTCDSSFADKSYFKRHVTSVHEGNKPFKCEMIL